MSGAHCWKGCRTILESIARSLFAQSTSSTRVTVFAKMYHVVVSILKVACVKCDIFNLMTDFAKGTPSTVRTPWSKCTLRKVSHPLVHFEIYRLFKIMSTSQWRHPDRAKYRQRLARVVLSPHTASRATSAISLSAISFFLCIQCEMFDCSKSNSWACSAPHPSCDCCGSVDL